MNNEINQEDKKGLGGPKVLLFAIIGVSVTASMVAFGLFTGSTSEEKDPPSVSSVVRTDSGFQPYKGDDSSAPPTPRRAAPTPPNPSEPPSTRPAAPPGRPLAPPTDDLSDSPPPPPEEQPPQAVVDIDPRNDFERQRDLDEEERRRLIDEERERHIKHFFGDDDPRKKVAPEKLELYKRLAEGPPRDLSNLRQLIQDSNIHELDQSAIQLQDSSDTQLNDVVRALRDSNTEMLGNAIEDGEREENRDKRKRRAEGDERDDEYSEEQEDGDHTDTGDFDAEQYDNTPVDGVNSDGDW